MNVKDEKILTIMVEVTFLMLEKLMVMKLKFRLASKMKDLEDGGEAAEGSDEEGGEVSGQGKLPLKSMFHLILLTGGLLCSVWSSQGGLQGASEWIKSCFH